MEFKFEDIVQSEEELYNEDNFVTIIQKAVLISSKNVILSSKMQNSVTSIRNSVSSKPPSSSTFSIHSHGSLNSYQNLENFEILDPFFLISQKFLKKLLSFPPKIKTNLKISKLNPELLFELGRQQTYLFLNQEALFTFEKACFHAEDPKALIWKLAIQLKYPKLMIEDKETCCSKRKSLGTDSKYKSILNSLQKMPQSIEANLLLLDLALSKNLQTGEDIENWQYYAGRVLKLDKFYGYFTFGTVYLKLDCSKGQRILHRLTEAFPSYPYPYIVLWEFYYERKEFLRSYDVIAECFLKVNDCKFGSFFNLVFVLYIKSLFKIKRFATALGMLQKKYEESENNLFYLFLFGKFCVKSRIKKLQATGLSALKEVLRWIKDYPKVSYWYGRVCFKLGKVLKAQKHFHKVFLTLNRNQVKYSVKIQRTLAKIEKVVAELNLLEKNLRTEGTDMVFIKEKNAFFNLLKVTQARCYLSQNNLQASKEILEKISTFESFFLIYQKIVPTLSFDESKFLLLKKIKALFKSPKVPLFEFLESCILFADYLKIHNNLDQALTILQRILNFYPNFSVDLPYVKRTTSTWISITLLGFKSVFGFNANKKKKLVMDAVNETVFNKPEYPKIKSNSSKNSLAVTESLDSVKSIAKTNNSKEIESISQYGVYTDAGVLLKIAEILSELEQNSESKEALSDFFLISRKPFDKYKFEELTHTNLTPK